MERTRLCPKIQYDTHDLYSPLEKKGTQRVQATAGTFLYYTRAVDPTILGSLNDIASKQSSPTTLTKSGCNKLLD